MGNKDDEGIGMVSDAAAERRAKRARARARKAALPQIPDDGASATGSAGPASELKTADTPTPRSEPDPADRAPEPAVEAGNATTDEVPAAASNDTVASAGANDAAIEDAQPEAKEAAPAETSGPAASLPQKSVIAAAPIVLPDSRPGDPARGTDTVSAAPRIDTRSPRTFAGASASEERTRRPGGGLFLASVAALAIVLGAGWYAYAQGWIYTGDGEPQMASADPSSVQATASDTDTATTAKSEPIPASDPSPSNRVEPDAEANLDAQNTLQAELQAARERLREAEARIAELERGDEAAAQAATSTQEDNAVSQNTPIRDVTPINRPEDDVESTSPDEPRSATAGAEDGAEIAATDIGNPRPEQAFPSEDGAGTQSAVADSAPPTPPALPLPRPPMLAATTQAPAPPSVVSGRPSQDDVAVASPRTAGDPILRGWYLRGVYDGMALIDGPSGLIEVMPGDRLPGTGRIQSIRRVGSGWAVVTSRGIIPFQP